MVMVTNPAVDAGAMMKYPPPYAVGRYMELDMGRPDVRRFVMIPIGETLAVKIGRTERETVHARWRR